MYCPYCGSQNKKKQNYCRFCGLSLHEIERSYLNQLIFGEDTKDTLTFRNVRKAVDYAEILLVVAGVTAVLTLYFSGYPVKLRLFGIVIVVAFLFDIVRRVVGHFERKRFRENNRNLDSTGTTKNDLKTGETAKLIEEKIFVPVASVTEDSTQLLTVQVRDKASETKGNLFEVGMKD